MGSVYRGKHSRLEIDVAIKCLDRTLSDRDEEFVKRFQREAMIAASITHENLVRVYDVGESDGLHYLIMEFVDGETIRERVLRKGRLAPVEAVSIILGAARGVAAAHHHRGGRVVHRDIKPDNILISIHGEVKVTDLGLSKALDAIDGVNTATQTVMGTPQYMPPEQFDDIKSVGASGDVYALGATLYFLLAGEDAIPKGTLTETYKRVCFEEFPDLASEFPSLPAELVAIVDRCVRKAAEERYRDARELVEDLEKLQKSKSVELADAKAGTGTLRRSLISPPPARTLAEVNRRLELGKLVSDPTLVEGPEGLTFGSRFNLRGMPRWGISVTVAVAVAIVVAVYLTRDGVENPGMGSGAENPKEFATPDRLEIVRTKERSGDLDGAYASILALLGDSPDDQELLKLRRSLTQAIRGALVEAVTVTSPRPGCPPIQGRTVSVRGTVRGTVGGNVEELWIDRAKVAIAGESFESEVVANSDGRREIPVEISSRHGIKVSLPSLIVVLDSAAPELSVGFPADGSLQGREIEWSGSATDSVSVVVEVRVDGEVATLVGNQWSYRLSLDDGEHRVSVAARDAAGNSERIDRSVVVDGTAPDLEILSPRSGERVRPGTVTLRLRATDLHDPIVTVEGAAMVQEGSNWSAKIRNVAPGKHRFTAKAVDRVGNKTERTVVVTAELGDEALAWAEVKPGVDIDDLSGLPKEVVDRATRIEMVLVRRGTYLQGANPSDPDAEENEKPQHEVKIEAFYLGKTEVTNEQYRLFRPDHDSGSWRQGSLDQNAQPVVEVTWKDAASFCEQYDMRLPTESEWEYACRGGSKERYPWGNNSTVGGAWANVDGADRFLATAPAGSLKTNEFGLYDMIGNVLEWCADPYEDRAYSSKEAPSESTRLRVIRGGSWRSKYASCRSSFRSANRSDRSSNMIGFRVARTP